jgi:superfamily II DNA or RNA helicase
MQPTLRPYQVDAVDRLRALIAAGQTRLCLVAPTGSGKTVMASAMIHGAARKGKRCLFLAHRKELIDQTVDKLHRWSVRPGVIMADDPRRDDYLPVQVASVPTLARRLNRLPPAELVVVDECHHATSDSYRKVIDAYAHAVVIGMTATPWRTDRNGLADIYTASVLAATPAELIASGALVPYDAFAYDAPDLHEVRVTMGEYHQKDLALACNTKILVGSVVREYTTHAAGRRAIVFPVNIEHSHSLVDEFRAAGFSAAHVDCNTPRDERGAAMERFRRGDLLVLSSVGVLTEGFDVPAAEVCILARPTKSLSLHLQMIGRVLRPASGKDRALIHDHAGNVMRHGFPDDDRDYSLTATPKSVVERNTCPACHAVFAGLRRCNGTGRCERPPEEPQACIAGPIGLTSPSHCPACNEFIQLPEERESSGGGPELEHTEGRRLSKEQIQELRSRRKGAGLRDLTDLQLQRAASATRIQKAAEFLRLCRVAEAKGFKKGFVSHQYRNVFGVWPRFADGELDGVEPAQRPFFPLEPRADRSVRRAGADQPSGPSRHR